jgi:hypothetical protein
VTRNRYAAHTGACRGHRLHCHRCARKYVSPDELYFSSATKSHDYLRGFHDGVVNVNANGVYCDVNWGGKARPEYLEGVYDGGSVSERIFEVGKVQLKYGHRCPDLGENP